MKHSIGLIILLMILGSIDTHLIAQDNLSSVEEAVEYINGIFEKNQYSDKYEIVSVGNDLIEFSVVSLKSKDFVGSMEKDGKTLDEFPATKVLNRNKDDSVLVESKSAMVISTMKKFQVKIDQSE